MSIKGLNEITKNAKKVTDYNKLLKNQNEEFNLVDKIEDVIIEKMYEIDEMLGKDNSFINEWNKSIDYTQIEEKYNSIVQGYVTISDYTVDLNGNIVKSTHPENASGIIIMTGHGDGSEDSNGNFNNSKLFIYDERTKKLIGVIDMGTVDHAGGITYDKENDIIYVSADQGKLHSYDANSIVDIYNKNRNNESDKTMEIKIEGSACEIPNDFNIRDDIIGNFENLNPGIDIVYNYTDQDGMDSLTFLDEKLYSGTYSGMGELYSTEFEYVRDESGKITSIKEKDTKLESANIGPAVQGIDFYEQDGKRYLVTASSARSKDDFEKIGNSLLIVYEVTDEGYVEVGSQMIEGGGLEGIQVDNEGNITGVFENNKSIQDDVRVIDTVDELKQSKSSKWEKFKLTVLGEAWDIFVDGFGGLFS